MLQHIVLDLGVGCPILKFGHIHIFQRELNPNLFRVDLALGKQDNRLNEKVEQGMINISMNTTPTFQNGSSAGNLMIVNESVNNYPQVVEIHRNDTGEVIYKSGAIPVGSKLETAKLSADLDAGTYECTALFYNVDPDSGEYLGCAGAVITVTVLE